MWLIRVQKGRYLRTHAVRPAFIAMVQTFSSIVKTHAASTHRRLVNSGVKKSGGASVKNGELSEDERNEMKLIKFFAV